MPIGELTAESGRPLLRMWDVSLQPMHRPFVRHNHTRFEIALVVSGSGTYRTEKGVYDMLPGDMFIFSSNEVHSITDVGGKGMTITNLHFEPRYLSREFSENTSERYLDFCFSHSDRFSCRICAQQAENLRDYFLRIRKELECRSDCYPTAARSYLHLLLVELLRNHHYGAEERAEGIPFDVWTVFDYIEVNLGSELTLKKISAVAGLSPNYFSTQFKRINGVSLWDYITTKRIEKAVKRIRHSNGDCTMLEIALQCGFNNTANFNKAFKKHTGITPSQLRKDPDMLSN